MDIVKIFQIIAYVSGSIVAIGTIIGFLIAWKKNAFKYFKPFTTMANTVNNFMSEILPSILLGFEKRDIVAEGTLSNWATIMTRELFTNSLKRLNEMGQKFLEESGIKQIIDNNVDNYIKILSEKKPESIYDIEEQSFYILKEEKIIKDSIPIKNFLYNESQVGIDMILFVGSIYLRDKYFEKHPEILPKDNK